MRIVFDKNVPVGVRRFLSGHEVRTFVEMQWHPQMENGELLEEAIRRISPVWGTRKTGGVTLTTR